MERLLPWFDLWDILDLHIWISFEAIILVIFILGVSISETELDDFYHLGFSNFCLHLYCYIDNVSADVSTSFLQVFLVELRGRHRTSKHGLYLIHEGHLLWFC